MSSVVKPSLNINLIKIKYGQRYYCSGYGIENYAIADRDANKLIFFILRKEIDNVFIQDHADMVVRRLNNDRLLYVGLVDDYVKDIDQYWQI